MGVSNFPAILVCSLLAGCGYVVHPGLANAPAPASPETHVHDAIANGHDACARSTFPQGEVLRGHIPPCNKETPPKASSFVQLPPAETSMSTPFPFGVCPPPLEHSGLTERGMIAFPLTEQRLWLACNPPSGTRGR
jgi:hypothetical protein